MRNLIDIIESAGHEYGYKQDNPVIRYGNDHAKSWLEHKIELAVSSGDPTFLRGAVTAWMGQERQLRLPTEVLARIPGAMNEKREPGEAQYDWLTKRVEENGWDDELAHILVAVNHEGSPYILEGNTRVAFAIRNGISDIAAEVRWFNGGEMVDGKWSPEEISKLAR